MIGSRLRTKLVLTLIFFTLAPTVLMFYVSTRFLTESFEVWFSSKVEETMHKTREAGALIYQRDKRRIESLARIALQKIKIVTPPIEGLGPYIDSSLLQGFVREYRLYAVRVFDSDGRMIWSSPTKEQALRMLKVMRLLHSLCYASKHNLG